MDGNFRLYKPVRYLYFEPMWRIENNVFIHDLVPKSLIVTPVKLIGTRHETAIITLSMEFGIPPIMFADLEPWAEFFIVKQPNAQPYVATLQEVDKLFADPFPQNYTEYMPITFNKRRSYGWLIWFKNASLFGLSPQVKVTDDMELLKHPQHADAVFETNGEKFMSERDYIGAKIHDAQGIVGLENVPYVKEITDNWLADMIVPANWIRFTYGMAIVLGWWMKYLCRYTNEQGLINGQPLHHVAFEACLHGLLRKDKGFVAKLTGEK